MDLSRRMTSPRYCSYLLRVIDKWLLDAHRYGNRRVEKNFKIVKGDLGGPLNVLKFRIIQQEYTQFLISVLVNFIQGALEHAHKLGGRKGAKIATNIHRPQKEPKLISLSQNLPICPIYWFNYVPPYHSGKIDEPSWY